MKNPEEFSGTAPNKSLSTLEPAELLHLSQSTICELIRRAGINSNYGWRKALFRRTTRTPFLPDPAIPR